MPAEAPALGSTATLSITVADSDLAAALLLDENDSFLRVFATPRMIALMEIASSRQLYPCCGPGQMSAGAGIDATHSAATPPGAKVTIVSTYVGRKGKLFEFDVVASDPAGVIGKARHRRAIVDTARLLEASERRGRGKL